MTGELVHLPCGESQKFLHSFLLQEEDRTKPGLGKNFPVQKRAKTNKYFKASPFPGKR